MVLADATATTSTIKTVGLGAAVATGTGPAAAFAKNTCGGRSRQNLGLGPATGLRVMNMQMRYPEKAYTSTGVPWPTSAIFLRFRHGMHNVKKQGVPGANLRPLGRKWDKGANKYHSHAHL